MTADKNIALGINDKLTADKNIAQVKEMDSFTESKEKFLGSTH